MDPLADARMDHERARATPDDIELEPITSEEEDYESAPPEYQISTFPDDFTLEVLHTKWKAAEILIPDFQRGFVWKQVQASKLIESFLVGLPVPAVFLYTERTSQNYFVIDGQQRLKSIFYFLEGYFGQTEDDKRRIFRLTGISDKSKFSGKTFEDLDQEDQRRLKNCVLRSFVVQQLDPNDDTSMYHSFQGIVPDKRPTDPSQRCSIPFVRGQGCPRSETGDALWGRQISHPGSHLPCLSESNRPECNS